MNIRIEIHSLKTQTLKIPPFHMMNGGSSTNLLSEVWPTGKMRLSNLNATKKNQRKRSGKKSLEAHPVKILLKMKRPPMTKLHTSKLEQSF